MPHQSIIKHPLGPTASHKPISIGTKFGALVIDSEPFKIEGRNTGHIYYECLCECGVRRPFYYCRITTKNNPAKSCGCGAGGPLDERICATPNCGRISKRGRLCGKCHYAKTGRKQHDAWVQGLRNNPYDFLRWRLYQAKSKRSRAIAAGKKHHTITITIDELYELWDKQQGKCALSNLHMVTQKNTMYTITMDRIESDKGYESGNVQLVCYSLNLAKLKWPDNEFRDFLKALRSIGA